MKIKIKIYLAASLIWLPLAFSATAQGVAWTQWTSTNANSAAGIMGGVDVSYSGEVYKYSTINNSGSNYWFPAATFTNSLVPISPNFSDVITLSSNGVCTLTFSKPVNNLVMDILSLGSINKPLTPSTYTFNSLFTIFSSGGDPWVPSGIGSNGTNCALYTADNYTLSGVEGSGCIVFSGQVSTLTWTVGNAESYSGFTIGMVDTPEPGTLALLGLGGLSLLRFHRRK